MKGGRVWCCSCIGERLLGNCAKWNRRGKLGVGLICSWRWCCVLTVMAEVQGGRKASEFPRVEQGVQCGHGAKGIVGVFVA